MPWDKIIWELKTNLPLANAFFEQSFKSYGIELSRFFHRTGRAAVPPCPTIWDSRCLETSWLGCWNASEISCPNIRMVLYPDVSRNVLPRPEFLPLSLQILSLIFTIELLRVCACWSVLYSLTHFRHLGSKIELLQSIRCYEQIWKHLNYAWFKSSRELWKICHM